MSARNEDVFPSIVIEIRDRRRIPGHGQAQLRHVALPGYFHEGAFPGVAVKRKRFPIESNQNNVGIAVIIEITEINAHAGNKRSVFAQGDVHIETNLLKPSGSFVAKEPVHQLVVGDEEIHLAGKIGVGGRDAHSFAWMRSKPPFDRGVPEGPIPVIDEQLIGRGLVHFGMAILAMAIALAYGLMIKVPLQIVEDDEVEQSIIVHINPGARDCPERPVLGIGLIKTSFGGYVHEGPVTIVVIERIALNARDKNVFVSVVIVVANCDSDIVASSRYPGLLGYVGEVSVAVVLEKAI